MSASSTIKGRFYGFFRGCPIFGGIFWVSLLVLFLFVVLPAIKNGMAEALESSDYERASNICRVLNAYAADHEGQYPEGKSSTEVFQKLIDAGYAAKPEEQAETKLYLNSLYCPLPGKVEAPGDAKVLKPENVCWDLTYNLDEHSPDEVPLVFMTGYKVTYQPGASAVPLPDNRSPWMKWWHGDNRLRFMAVTCKDLSTRIIPASQDGTIPNFIPADFDPKGKVYRQLTPDGELPP